MAVYVTIALNVYLRLLYHIYEKRGDFSEDKGEQSVESPSTKRDSTGSQ
jgi:hypothetical protein